MGLGKIATGKSRVCELSELNLAPPQYPQREERLFVYPTAKRLRHDIGKQQLKDLVYFNPRSNRLG